MRHGSRLVAAALALAASVAQAGDPAELLVRMSVAARQSNYQGVVVYRDARTMEVLRVVHRQREGRVQERLTSLTGKPRDVLQEGDQLACFVGSRSTEAGGLPGGLFPVITAATLSQAASHYQFRALGEARVAGRSCQGVALEPRDEYRYGYEVCADALTAVPLRVTLRDAAGKTIEQLMFTEVVFPAYISDAAFAPPPGATALARRASDATTPSARASWQLAQLPPGFREVMRSRQAAADGGGIVEHVLLSDGLSAVSVFGRQGNAGAQFTGLSGMGAMNAYGRSVGPFQVTVVGEVPSTTVRFIGDGFQPTAQAKAD